MINRRYPCLYHFQRKVEDGLFASVWTAVDTNLDQANKDAALIMALTDGSKRQLMVEFAEKHGPSMSYYLARRAIVADEREREDFVAGRQASMNLLMHTERLGAQWLTSEMEADTQIKVAGFNFGSDLVAAAGNILPF